MTPQQELDLNLRALELLFRDDAPLSDETYAQARACFDRVAEIMMLQQATPESEATA